MDSSIHPDKHAHTDPVDKVHDEEYTLFKTYFFVFLILFIIKRVAFNTVIFSEFSIRYFFGLEIVTVISFFLFVELLFKRKKLWGYFIFNLLSSIFFIVVILYHSYYGTLPSYHVLYQLSEAGKVGESIGALLNPAYFLFMLDTVILGLLLKKFDFKTDIFTTIKPRKLFISFLVFCIFSIAVPITHASEIAKDRNKKIQGMGIVNYQFASIYSQLFAEPVITDANQINNDLISKTKGIKDITNPEFFGAAKDMNVIMVQLEAFQNFPIGREINGNEITPVLNQLTSESFYFTNFYQQISQGNTVDAEFLVNTSLYPSGQYVTAKRYAEKEIPSLPRLLKGIGYQTATLHTNDKEFYNRGEFYKALGFDRVYDKEFFGEDRTLLFGEIDELLYRDSINELVKLSENNNRFYAHYIAMSSHHPFKMPKDLQKLNLPKGYEGTLLGDYLQSIHYADFALGVLVEELKKNNLWDNTLLVIYGDHFAIHSDTVQNKDKAMLEDFIGEPYTKLTMMNTPLIIKVPGIEGEKRNNVGGQVDILPTITNLLGMNINSVHFGQDLLNAQPNLLPQRFYMENGSYINDNVMYSSSDSKTLSLNGTASGFEKNQIEEDYNKTLRLLEYSDLYLENLPNR
ncbi:LTA synthase family protein [Neobacillus sp. SCS-31]|uniref:LTA synthase family protein n=1 Tax=Neobacillus oceani TaxID=3115292 RepID=UPI003905EC23